MNFAGLILYLKDQCVEIVHNNALHISNVLLHILMMDIHTLLPYPCKMHIDVVPEKVIWTVNWLHYLNYEIIPCISSTRN